VSQNGTHGGRSGCDDGQIVGLRGGTAGQLRCYTGTYLRREARGGQGRGRDCRGTARCATCDPRKVARPRAGKAGWPEGSSLEYEPVGTKAHPVGSPLPVGAGEGGSANPVREPGPCFVFFRRCRGCAQTAHIAIGAMCLVRHIGPCHPRGRRHLGLMAARLNPARSGMDLTLSSSMRKKAAPKKVEGPASPR
jgi:hypothetical protein